MAIYFMGSQVSRILGPVRLNACFPPRSLKAYLAVGWNCMDVVSVTCFVVALVLRTAWMLRMTMAQINDYEEDNAVYGTNSVGRIEARITADQLCDAGCDASVTQRA